MVNYPDEIPVQYITGTVVRATGGGEKCPSTLTIPP